MVSRTSTTDLALYHPSSSEPRQVSTGSPILIANVIDKMSLRKETTIQLMTSHYTRPVSHIWLERKLLGWSKGIYLAWDGQQ